jgi:hypothetical protein
MTSVPANDLRSVKDKLLLYRGEIVAAIDYLFIGV